MISFIYEPAEANSRRRWLRSFRPPSSSTSKLSTTSAAGSQRAIQAIDDILYPRKSERAQVVEKNCVQLWERMFGNIDIFSLF